MFVTSTFGTVSNFFEAVRETQNWMMQRMSHIGNAKLNISGKVSPSLLFIHSSLQNKNTGKWNIWSREMRPHTFSIKSLVLLRKPRSFWRIVTFQIYLFRIKHVSQSFSRLLFSLFISSGVFLYFFSKRWS